MFDDDDDDFYTNIFTLNTFWIYSFSVCVDFHLTNHHPIQCCYCCCMLNVIFFRQKFVASIIIIIMLMTITCHSDLIYYCYHYGICLLLLSLLNVVTENTNFTLFSTPKHYQNPKIIIWSGNGTKTKQKKLKLKDQKFERNQNHLGKNFFDIWNLEILLKKKQFNFIYLLYTEQKKGMMITWMTISILLKIKKKNLSQQSSIYLNAKNFHFFIYFHRFLHYHGWWSSLIL